MLPISLQSTSDLSNILWRPAADHAKFRAYSIRSSLDSRKISRWIVWICPNSRPNPTADHGDKRPPSHGGSPRICLGFSSWVLRSAIVLTLCCFCLDDPCNSMVFRTRKNVLVERFMLQHRGRGRKNRIQSSSILNEPKNWKALAGFALVCD
jgi:hypothetical protein